MATIRDFLTKVGWKIDTTSQAGRVTLYTSDGTELTGTQDSSIDISLSALSATVELDMAGHNGVGFTITNMGHANNVIIAEYTMDGTWVNAVIASSSNNSTLTCTLPGTYTIRFIGGISKVRLRMSSYTSGAVTGTMNASYALSQNNTIRAYDNVLSVVNSTTAQLAAGATFTGAWEADIYWQGITSGYFADQDLTVVFEQSNDGVTVHHSDAFYYRANSTGQDSSTAVNLISNYHRVKITNSGASPTTTFFANTYATPNFSAEPRGLTRAGNKRVEVPEKATYRATFTGTPVATLTFSLKGSATKIVKITRFGFSQSGTASTLISVTVKKYSSILTGTGVTITGVPLDTRTAAATAVAQNWTTTPGTQTSVGTLNTHKYRSQLAGDNFFTPEAIYEFGNSQRGASALILVGTSQWAGIDLSAFVANADANLWVEWTEE